MLSLSVNQKPVLTPNCRFPLILSVVELLPGTYVPAVPMARVHTLTPFFEMLPAGITCRQHIAASVKEDNVKFS